MKFESNITLDHGENVDRFLLSRRLYPIEFLFK